ncbi:uncharacterized protein EV420DRAFT_606821 [Desarmillaria tabescens]|uniref:Uncharacterized protein n=1 Tax=Armillaria tabescens TaxID=1929756 RepID=A0AA39K6C5_ARMTA|nr:uncharacterized protein EV420DRAFT_606821 [Desarmillaria tabescens]KAK0454260.1 hypothetical protein EV420DRAFT_606821 [Desarmillaria tabescens]
MFDTLHNLCTFSSKPGSRWTPVQIPDLEGKIVRVTGGSSGIGKEIVRHANWSNTIILRFFLLWPTMRGAWTSLWTVASLENGKQCNIR